MWVEITSPSQTVADVEIKMTYGSASRKCRRRATIRGLRERLLGRGANRVMITPWANTG
jgi:hypothetical protein